MIKLTRLDGEPFVLNADLIQYLESRGDTFVTMTKGKWLFAEPNDVEQRSRVRIEECTKEELRDQWRTFGVAVLGIGFTMLLAFRSLPLALVALVPNGIPILMVTGLEDIDSVNRAYSAGATDFLPKPINWSLIAHRVRYVLRASRCG